MAEIERFMLERLKLKCNRKTQVIPLSHGIPFVGKRIWANKILLRKSTVKHMKRALRKIAEEYRNYEITLDRAMQTVISYIGLLSHCNGEGLKEWISQNISFTHGDSYGEWNGEYEQIAA